MAFSRFLATAAAFAFVTQTTGIKVARAEGCGILLPICAVVLLPLALGEYAVEEAKDDARNREFRARRAADDRKTGVEFVRGAWRLIASQPPGDYANPAFQVLLKSKIEGVTSRCQPRENKALVYSHCDDADAEAQAAYAAAYPARSAEFRAGRLFAGTPSPALARALYVGPSPRQVIVAYWAGKTKRAPESAETNRLFAAWEAEDAQERRYYSGAESAYAEALPAPVSIK